MVFASEKLPPVNVVLAYLPTCLSRTYPLTFKQTSSKHKFFEEKFSKLGIYSLKRRLNARLFNDVGDIII